MSTRNARSAGLGSLLAAPVPPADQDDPEFAAHQARSKGDQPDRLWVATDNRSGKELARVHAPNEKAAVKAASEETGRRGGFSVAELDPAAPEPSRLPARTSRTTGALATRGGPAVLPRKRTARVPKDKLTVQVPVAVLDGLDTLIDRDDTRKYDEVEEALRKHLADKGIELDED